MRTLLALVCSLAPAAVLRSQTAGGDVVAQAAPAAPAVRRVAAAAKTAPPEGVRKAEPAKKDGSTKIEGVEVPRTKGGFLGVQIVDATFKISFYDAKKKPVAADVSRALLRWDPKYKVGQERVVLNRSEDGKALASPRNIRPPYLFKLTIVLLKDAAAEGDDQVAGETYVIDFRA